MELRQDPGFVQEAKACMTDASRKKLEQCEYMITGIGATVRGRHHGSGTPLLLRR